jgi:hypothetical protein
MMRTLSLNRWWTRWLLRQGGGNCRKYPQLKAFGAQTEPISAYAASGNPKYPQQLSLSSYASIK